MAGKPINRTNPFSREAFRHLSDAEFDNLADRDLARKTPDGAAPMMPLMRSLSLDALRDGASCIEGINEDDRRAAINAIKKRIGLE
jgi:hypothetical protein